MVDALLRTEELTKTFHQVVANDRISFDVQPGEIHCLLGENGAGKSTLAECLYGYYRPDSGRIFFRGEKVELTSPAHAIKVGIGMVHQHFVLVDSLSVLENVVVGGQDTSLILDLKTAAAKLTALCDKYDVDLDLHANIWELPVGKQQWVEILKALSTDARLLILDEPTAVLTPQESKTLFRILRQMTDEGISIVLITHKLNEVLQSDRVTVLRRGQKVATVTTRDSSKEELTNMMVGRSVEFTVLRGNEANMGDPILEISNLCAKDERDSEALQNLSLTVRAGEIVGIAGVAGNGQRELFETIVGLRRATSGHVLLDGQEILGMSPKQIMAKGVGFIPEDRIAEGVVGPFTVAENLVLGQHDQPEFSSFGLLNRKKIAAFAQSAIDAFDIKTPSSETVTSTLSGGNVQKVILAREFAHSSRCILANQPSRGLDVGIIDYVHQRLLEKRDEGMAILLASEELEEIFNVADRIAVIFNGEILATFATDEASVDTIGLLMAGDRSHADLSQPAPTQS